MAGKQTVVGKVDAIVAVAVVEKAVKPSGKVGKSKGKTLDRSRDFGHVYGGLSGEAYEQDGIVYDINGNSLTPVVEGTEPVAETPAEVPEVEAEPAPAEATADVIDESALEKL